MSITLTDRSYWVLRLARRQADARRAEHIATRDILDGLGLEGSGVAAEIMRHLHLPFVKASARESLAQISCGMRGPRLKPAILVGEARAMFIRAESEAENCFRQWENPPTRSAWLGTEHLLLAITSGNEESGTVILRGSLAEIGITFNELRTLVFELLGLNTSR